MSARDFDFWLGEWDVRWDEGRCGTNRVELSLDGRVVLEQFDGRPGTQLRGMSVSVYDDREAVWRQTWVDNQGNHIQFAGAFRDGVMDLRGERDGSPVRMQWRDIRGDAMTWLWERSDDRGENWMTLWELRYRRRAEPR